MHSLCPVVATPRCVTTLPDHLSEQIELNRCVPGLKLRAMNVVITNRDEELLSTLSLKIHLASLEQIASAWWAEATAPDRQARERLRKLEADDWLLRKRVNIHPLLGLVSPVVRWSPLDAAPDFGAVAYQLQKRWTEKLELITVYIASRKTANHFGGFGGKFKHRNQLTHDLHLADVYFSMVYRDRSLATKWSGEEERFSDGEKLPDAVLLDSKGRVTEVIEFGGRYDRRRVEAFHHYCEVRRFPYQLW